MVIYDKDEKKLVIPASINYETLNVYQSGYTSGFQSGYTDGLSACTKDYSGEYFTLTSLEEPHPDFPGILPAIHITHSNISYRYVHPDGTCSEWFQTSGGSEDDLWAIDMFVDTKVQFKSDEGALNSLFSNSYMAEYQFSICGNAESLEYGDDFIGQDTIKRPGAFTYFFSGCTGLVDASNLVLPAVNLKKNCYLGMFRECSGLVAAPELPATNLAESCYNAMFYGCTSLVSAPELPATNLVQTYYRGMFQDCSLINHIKCLAVTFSAANSTTNWLSGVSPTGTFETHSTTSWSTGASGIPEGWTRVNYD